MTRSPRPGPRPERTAAITAALARWHLPLYGLDQTWTGRRWIGGHGSSSGRTTQITLAHGDAWAEDSPLVRVETAVLDGGMVPEAHAARGLARKLFHDTGEHLPAIRDTFRSDDPLAAWDEVGLNVDGEVVTFHALFSEPYWVAVREAGDCLVSIEARHAHPNLVYLVKIQDIEPYLADDGRPIHGV